MKVIRQSEPKFIPVVITLESQEEVDILHNLSGSISGTGKARRVTDRLYAELSYYSSSTHIDHFEGKLTVRPY